MRVTIATGMLQLRSHNLTLILERLCSPTRPCLGKESPALSWSVSGNSHPGIVKADNQKANTKQTIRRLEPPDSSGSPEPNAAKLVGTPWSPHLFLDSPAAKTSLSLVVPVLLIAHSCCPYRDVACLPFVYLSLPPTRHDLTHVLPFA